MKRRGKIIATISTLCLALVMLTASVLAATSVSFNIGGSVSYIIDDVYVEFEARVYSSSKHFASDEELATASETLASSNFTALNAKTKLNDGEDYTFNKEQIKNTSNPSLWSESNEDYFDFYSSVTGGEHTSLDIDLAYSTTTQKFTYFVVIEVTNLSSETVYAYVNTDAENALVFPENSYTYNLESYETLTSTDNTKYIVFAFGLKDITLGIEGSDFNFPIVVTMEEPEIAYPAIAVENKSSVDEQTTVSTDLDGATNHKLAVQTVSSIQLVGMDFSLNQAQESGIQAYSSSDSITLSFEIWFKDVSAEYVEMGIPENLTLYQYAMIESGGKLSFAEYLNYLSGILFVYSDSIENYTTTSTPLTNEDNGLVISVVLDESTNVETYTVTIPKTEVTSGNFSIILNPELIVLLETTGANMNFEKLWSSTENLQTSWKGLSDVTTEKYQIGGESFTFNNAEIKTLEGQGLCYALIPFEVLEIPADENALEIVVNLQNNTSVFAHSLLKGKHNTYTDDTSLVITSILSGYVDGFGYSLPLPLENNQMTICLLLAKQTLPSITISTNFEGIQYFTYEWVTYTNDTLDEVTMYTITGLTDEGKKLDTITIPDTHVNNKIEVIGTNAFKDNKTLKNIVIGNCIGQIRSGAFAGCSALESIEIPDGRIEIHYGAFAGCSALESIEIPDSVVVLGNDFISGCSSLKKIVCNAEILSPLMKDSSYHPFGGEFGSSEGVEIVIGMEGSENTIIIPNYMFYNCSANIKSLVIESNVKEIGSYAFTGCTGLTSIFMKHTSSSALTYLGTEWNGNATVYYYSETEPTAEGNYWHYDDNGNPTLW